MRRELLYLLFVILVSSCVSSPVQTTLDDVESYIMERPDSALSVLDSIDRDLLDTRRLRAQHALLHVMALDKNYINVTDDSTVLVAVDYYSKFGPKKYLARSLYYYGIIYFNRAEYENAIVELTKAEKVAEKCDSLYWGISMMTQGEVYHETYNDFEELKCLGSAKEVFAALSNQHYLNGVNLQLAYANANLENFEDALQILNELLHRDDVIYAVAAAALKLYAYIEVVKDKPDMEHARELYDSYTDKYTIDHLTEKDYWAWAYVLYMTGSKDMSEMIVDQLISEGVTGVGAFWLYRINKGKGAWEEALRYLEKSYKYSDDTVEDLLKQSLSVAQRDYYDMHAETVEVKSRSRALSLLFVIVILFLVIVVMVLLIGRFKRNHAEEKEKLLEYAEEIKRQLAAAEEDDYPALKKKYIALYKSRFETIGTLCDQYLKNHDRSDAEKLMYRDVGGLIDEVRNDSIRRRRFEAVLDAELDNIMTNFRTELPKFKEMDVAVFCFVVAGFDPTTIARLLDVSLNNVYVHKHRIRSRIEALQPEHAEQFLEMFV